MDVHGLGRDGRETTRVLRASSGPNRSTPDIGVTGAVAAAEIEACRAAGMDDWVAKPIVASDLHAAIARQFARNQEEQWRGQDGAGLG